MYIQTIYFLHNFNGIIERKDVKMEKLSIVGTMIDLKPPLRLIHMLERPADFSLSLHSHSFFHIIFVTSGTLDIMVKNQTYSIHENQAVILPPYLPHMLSSKTGYAQIGIDVEDEAEHYEMCALLKQTFPTGFHIQNLHIRSDRFDKFVKGSHDLTRFNLLKLQNRAESLVLLFIEEVSESPNNNFRDKFLDMIAHDEELNMSLAEMCRYLNLSKTHLERLVKEEFGCSAVEYYSKLRLMRACFLLQNSDLSMREISERLGFYDESHFTRFFKRHNGMTPKGYRNSSRIVH